METQHTGPNPLCEIGRTHPRDRHRMKPLEGHPGIWECPRHDMYATIVIGTSTSSIGCSEEAYTRLDTAAEVEALHARMAAEGVAIRHPLEAEPDFVWFRCADPDGHLIEIYWEPQGDAA